MQTLLNIRLLFIKLIRRHEFSRLREKFLFDNGNSHFQDKMINVLSNGGGDADLSNGKAPPAAEDKASKDGEGGGSPNRKAPPPPKPSLLVTKEMTTTAAAVSACPNPKIDMLANIACIEE